MSFMDFYPIPPEPLVNPQAPSLAPQFTSPAVPYIAPSVLPPTVTPNAPPQAGSLGQSLEPVPLPRPRPAESETTPAGAKPTQGATSPQGTMADRLVAALKNVQLPPPPQAQLVHTPAPPRPSTQIKPGDLEGLLAAVNLVGGRPPQLSTLGQYIGK